VAEVAAEWVTEAAVWLKLSASATLKWTGGQPPVACVVASLPMGLDAYNVVHCLSKSGPHSQVYQATHMDTGTTVAIKRIQIHDMHPSMRKECDVEVQVLQKMDHPNLIKYHEHFTKDNDLYIVMELASGGTFASTIEGAKQANSRVEESTMWRWIYDAAGALAYLHTRRVLHRDVKPSHIYLGENGSAKLGNFGLSRPMSLQTQCAFSCVGTPFYMSPEIVKGEGYSFASDVWSLGCAFYELATHLPPFHRQDMDFYALGDAICSARYPALSSSEWSKELIALVTEILKVDPTKRITAQRILDIATTHLVGRIQDFEIAGTLGRGRFSEVHRASWKHPGGDVREIALKRVQIFEMESDARKECVNEVNLLKSLNRPTILKYLDNFIEGSELVIVLELAHHGDVAALSRSLQRDTRMLTESQIWAIFFQVCDALYYMHGRRIMHRDIKPANIFLCSGGVVKLGDLGLGRYFSSNTYKAYSVVGTPFYMSPEVITQSEGYSFKSDIWSLGCVLYELSALTSPFESSKLNYYALGNKIRKGEYTPLPESTSPRIRDVCDAMLKVQSEARIDVPALYVAVDEHFARCPEAQREELHQAESVNETGRVHRQLTKASAVVRLLLESVESPRTPSLESAEHPAAPAPGVRSNSGRHPESAPRPGKAASLPLRSARGDRGSVAVPPAEPAPSAAKRRPAPPSVPPPSAPLPAATAVAPPSQPPHSARTRHEKVRYGASSAGSLSARGRSQEVPRDHRDREAKGYGHAPYPSVRNHPEGRLDPLSHCSGRRSSTPPRSVGSIGPQRPADRGHASEGSIGLSKSEKPLPPIQRSRQTPREAFGDRRGSSEPDRGSLPTAKHGSHGHAAVAAEARTPLKTPGNGVSVETTPDGGSANGLSSRQSANAGYSPLARVGVAALAVAEEPSRARSPSKRLLVHGGVTAAAAMQPH